VIDLSSFHARQKRDILVDLAASPTGEGRRVVADAHLHFTDVTGASDRRVSNSTSLVAVGTEDADKRARTEDWVTERVEQVVYAENLEAATEAYDNGNEEKARNVIERQKKRLDDAAEKDLFSDKKVEEKKRDLEEKESTIRGRGAESSSGERMQKQSESESLELMQDSSAF
jgi:ribosomal protein S20